MARKWCIWYGKGVAYSAENSKIVNLINKYKMFLIITKYGQRSFIGLIICEINTVKIILRRLCMHRTF